MFSKNTDPIDNYLELQEKTNIMKEKEEHAHHEAHKRTHA